MNALIKFFFKRAVLINCNLCIANCPNFMENVLTPPILFGNVPIEVDKVVFCGFRSAQGNTQVFLRPRLPTKVQQIHKNI